MKQGFSQCTHTLHSAGELRSGELQIDVALLNLQMEPVLQICTAQRALTELFMHAKRGIHITPSEPDVVGVHRKGEPFESLEGLDHVALDPLRLTVKKTMTECTWAIFFVWKSNVSK